MDTPSAFTPSSSPPETLPETALVFAFRQKSMLISGTSAAPSVPTLQELTTLGLSGRHHYLGELSGVSCVAVLLDEALDLPSDLVFSGLRSLFLRISDDELALAGRAFQIVEWDRTHRFCGVCGTPTTDRAGERAKQCPGCGYVAYPEFPPP